MISVGDKITDGTVEWEVKDIRGGADGNPVGTILAFTGNGVIPDGYLFCDGAAISRTDYADLFAVISTTYGSGDGSTTFNLPNTIGRFLEGNGVAGSYISPGLPNLWGHIYNGVFDTVSTDGVFTQSTSGNAYGGGTGSYYKRTAIMDASRLAGLYGLSSTVQPAALCIRYIIKY